MLWLIVITVTEGTIDERVIDVSGEFDCFRTATRKTGQMLVWRKKRDMITNEVYWYSKVNEITHVECREGM